MTAWKPLRTWCALTALTAALGSSLLSSPLAHAASPAAAPGATGASAGLTLEQLFRAESYRGELAREPSFSRSGRYLAFLWNPFGEPGSDLHVYDTKTGKTQRLTSAGIMQAFDAPEDLERFAKKLKQKRDELAERQSREVAQQAYLRGEPVDMSQWENAAIETLKKELAEKKAKDEAQKAADKAEAEAEKRAAEALAAKRAGKPLPAADAASAVAKADSKADAKAEEKALWELRDELKKKLEKNKLKPSDLYPGVSQLAWAHQRDELIFQYRGSLFRWQAGQDRIQPLLATQRQLRIVGYTPDDQGFIYMDETRVLRSRFASAAVQVLNRELIHGDDEDKKYRIEQTVISEDGRWMSLFARAPLTAADGKGPAPKPGRQVDMTDYSGRFAVAKKIDREISDDKRIEQPLALYIRKVPGLDAAPARQPKPVFTHPGGDTWFEISPVAWAKDGSHYAFATFEREKELLRVYLGSNDENAKPEMILERRGDVHHELVNVMQPRFTPDGKQLVLILSDADWRQPYAYTLANKQLRPLVSGAFEAFDVLGFTPDSQQMFVVSNKDELAAMNLWRVSLANGQMQRLGAAGEYHRHAVVSEDGQWLAANAGNWMQRPELKLLKGLSATAEAAKTLTQSHDPAFDKVHLLQPERFSFKNRHGDTIPAYVFKPTGWQASDKRPAVVYVYGGPLNARNTVEVDSFQATGYLFGMYMAAKHGYVTVSVDTRGHSNYGRRFADANFEQAGLPQTEDLLDLVQYMNANLGIDSRRIGLNGWSFGGFQTQYTMYSQPDVFAAGIAGAGPTEWENYNSWYSGRTIGKVDRTKPVLRKYSLLPMARGLKHPLMLVHGMQDDNVLYQDTVNVYRALLESGKESLVELFLDPDGAHAMGGAVKPVGWHRKYEAFWLQHLGQAR
ncbi:prolyl oligopeptidase family serine peptidase [Paucibacter sp. APW11]|uniref:Prolyl oligopeptidase family serine peptidase n=1 Tax=Roseateles aquae TaxID=3077235 RepID=A0ABU3PET8_9BURK|nr:prolyl oligopeptidase family serine peptidase [Paucibacter sp. APW11]MDT9000613.1 prolyl oligopeptidase family serine peptidase [Paucibacter sp. APW11]